MIDPRMMEVDGTECFCAAQRDRSGNDCLCRVDSDPSDPAETLYLHLIRQGWRHEQVTGSISSQ